MSSSSFCMYGCNQISRCTRPRARAREPAPVVVRLRATRRPDRRPRTVVRSVRRPSQLDRPGRVSVRTPVDGNGTGPGGRRGGARGARLAWRVARPGWRPDANGVVRAAAGSRAPPSNGPVCGPTPESSHFCGRKLFSPYKVPLGNESAPADCRPRGKRAMHRSASA